MLKLAKTAGQERIAFAAPKIAQAKKHIQTTVDASANVITSAGQLINRTRTTLSKRVVVGPHDVSSFVFDMGRFSNRPEMLVYKIREYRFMRA